MQGVAVARTKAKAYFEARIDTPSYHRRLSTSSPFWRDFDLLETPAVSRQRESETFGRRQASNFFWADRAADQSCDRKTRPVSPKKKSAHLKPQISTKQHIEPHHHVIILWRTRLTLTASNLAFALTGVARERIEHGPYLSVIRRAGFSSAVVLLLFSF